MGRPDDARAGAERRCAGKLHGLLHKLRDVRGNDKGIGAGVAHAVSLALSTRSHVALLGYLPSGCRQVDVVAPG